jgi:hypothetical protein
VELVCTLEGNPRGVTFGRIIPDSFRLDPDGTLTAQITLNEGVNAFDFSVNDSLGNIHKESFAWTFDDEAPVITIFTDLDAPVNAPRLLLTGRVTADTAALTFEGANVTLVGSEFRFFWDVSAEGANNATFYAVDDVGNEVTLRVEVFRDTTTNCRVVTPDRGSSTGDNPLLVAGRCDADVIVHVNNVQVPVALDGTWSVNVNLARGQNTIQVTGLDGNGATYYDEVQVFYGGARPPSSVGLLILFGLLAAGALAASFYISRRPRQRREAEEPRPQTGAQKAPPRPKPMTVKLPEQPDDMAYRPKPPPKP